MNINTKIPAVRNVVSIALGGFLISSAVIFLLFMMKNFEVEPSAWAFFFNICKWMTEFMFILVYGIMAQEFYKDVMTWLDEKNIKPLEPSEQEQINETI